MTKEYIEEYGEYLKLNKSKEKQRDYLNAINRIIKCGYNSLDIINMDQEELEELLNNVFKESSSGSVRTISYNIQNYYKWLEDEGINVNNIIKNIKSISEHISVQKLPKEAKSLLNKDEIYNIVKKYLGKKYNGIGAINTAMLFEGIAGKNYINIINFNFNDYYVNSNTISIKGTKFVTSSDLVDVLNIYKEKYWDGKEDAVRHYRKKENKNSIKAQAISNNIKKLGETSKTYLNTIKVLNAGKCYYAKQLQLYLNNSLHNKEFLQICKKFNSKIKTTEPLYEFEELYNYYCKLGKSPQKIDDSSIKICESILAINVEELYTKIFDNALPPMESGEEPQHPNAELGRIGELIVKAYLTHYYKLDAMVEDVADKNYGYDISIKFKKRYKCIEVKTTQNIYNGFRFYLTSHELKILNDVKEKYSIFLVLYKDDYATIYEIKNPIETIEGLRQYLQNGNEEKCIITPDTLKVVVTNNYLKKLPKYEVEESMLLKIK